MKYPGRLSAAQHDAFMARYFPTFISGSLLCMWAAGSGLALWYSGYLRGMPGGPAYVITAGVILCLLLCAGQFAWIRGWRWGTWLVLPSLLGPALMATGLFGTRHAGLGQMIVLALSLFGLLVINSKKHRAMRRRLEQMRLQRQGAMPATRADEFPDGPPPAKPWVANLVLGLLAILTLGKVYVFFWG